MSVELKLEIWVRGYDDPKRDAVRAALEKLLEDEQLADDFGPITEKKDKDGKYLFCGTISTVIISGFHRWSPKFEKSLDKLVKVANGKSCSTDLRVEEQGLDWRQFEDSDDD